MAPEWSVAVNSAVMAGFVQTLAVAWILGTLMGAITLMFSGRK